MKKFSLFIVLASVFSLLAAVPEYLVTGKNPARLEKIAAEELQLFYQKIYGKKLKVVSESAAKGKSAVYLGNTAFAKANGIDCSKADKEEWILRTKGKNLIITGGVPAGTLYGVYAVLERLGVGFIAPEETVIPGNKPDFPVFNERKKPDMEGRLIYDGISNHLHRVKAPDESRKMYVKWLLRNRINGCATRHVPPIYVGGMYNIPHPQYHNFCYYVPRSLFDKHPEYFQMDEQGRRLKPLSDSMSGSLCLSNKDVRRITLESLRRMIKEDRKKFAKEDWPYVYDISQLDNAPYFCKCSDCKKISAIDGSETGLLLDYINHVAREIRKEYPEIVIRTFGYSASKVPPKKIMPEKNVLIQLTDSFSSRDPYKPTESTLDKWYSFYFNEWFKAAPTLMMWDYWNLGGATYSNPPRVDTVFDAIQPDIRFFHRNKVRAMFYEASMDGSSPQVFMLLNYFVTSHLMVDVNADVEKLADQYIKGYFGPAAKVMKKYFLAIREGVRKDPQKANTCVVGHWRFLTPEFMLNLYKDYHAEIAKLPENSRFAKRIRHELCSPVWYTLANWASYEKIFTSAGISRAQLIKECRTYANEFILRYGAKNPERMVKYFETRFEPITLTIPRPEKFKDVPGHNFRMITYRNFSQKRNLGTTVVNDAESIHGKALKMSDPRPENQGANKLLSKKYKFYTTQFVLGNHKAPGRVELILKELPQDEKYHWFRIPGAIELRAVSYFWAHAWAVQASTKHWYMLTDGNPLDNTWDQVWFHAKFTGPAYVKGSKKENAFYIDMVAVVRNTKDSAFADISAYRNMTNINKKSKLPQGWEVNGYYKPTGKAELISKDGKAAFKVTANPAKPTVLTGPMIPCGKDDVIRVRVRSNGPKCEIGMYYFKTKGFNGRTFVKAPDTGRQNEYIFYPGQNKKPGVARCRLALYIPKGTATYEFDQIEIAVAKDLNKFNKDK